jgi:type I restriction enzyme R subunit
MNETQLENLCLDWFLDNGWEVVHGVDIAPDSSNPLRKDYKQILVVFQKVC